MHPAPEQYLIVCFVCDNSLQQHVAKYLQESLCRLKYEEGTKRQAFNAFKEEIETKIIEEIVNISVLSYHPDKD